MLFRSLTVIDPASSVHGITVDLRIVDGLITELSERLTTDEGEEIFEFTAASVSPGFVDIGAYLGDPGHEEREDIDSLIASASAGGYVAVAVLPNTEPVRQSIADMRYLAPRNGSGAVDLLGLAALSKDTAGKDLTQMMELSTAGALAFTDGPNNSATASLLKRGLEYALAFGGTIIDTPYDGELSEDGQIHEGEVSVRLGLPGIPAMCETIPLRRNLTLTRYTEGKLIVHLLSSGESLDLIKEFRTAGGKLSGSTVSAHHLTFSDRDLLDFDPNFKLLPPLRASSDRDALRAGILDGSIDAIVSHHRARHREEKDLEFTYSAFGARGLETAFRQLLTWGRDRDSLAKIISALTAGPRQLLGLPRVTVAAGQKAQLTIYTTTGKSEITAGDLKGKTLNSPLLGKELPGRILATFNNGRLWTSA